jgi:hypothetical protein
MSGGEIFHYCFKDSGRLCVWDESIQSKSTFFLLSLKPCDGGPSLEIIWQSSEIWFDLIVILVELELLTYLLLFIFFFYIN